MFWSTEIEPRSSVSQECYLDLVVTSVVLGEGAKAGERVFLKVDYPLTAEDTESAVLATLSAGVTENVPLKVMFAEEDTVKFINTSKSAKLHLCGHFLEPDFDDEEDFDDENLTDAQREKLMALQGALQDEDSDDEEYSGSEEDEEEDDEYSSDEEDLEFGQQEDISDDVRLELEALAKDAQKLLGKKRSAPQESAGKRQKVTETKEAKKTPAKEKKTPAKEKKTPAKEAKKTPAKEAKKTPAKEAKKTPAKETKKTPAKEAKTPKKDAQTPGKAPNTPIPIQKLAGGLQVADLKGGEGKKVAKKGSTVTVQYIGRLAASKKVFDKSKSFTFRLGMGEVIKGWDLGVDGMRVGGKRKLLIPPKLAYGRSGAPPEIPPNAKLEFDVVLLNC